MSTTGSLVVVTPSTTDLVALTLAKAHLRVDITDDDTLIAAYISAASELISSYTRRSYLTTVYDYLLDDFPRVTSYGRTVAPRTDIDILLPVSPVASVGSVKYYDADNVQQTMDAALYQVDSASNPARLRPVNGAQWPQVYGAPWPVTVSDPWPGVYSNLWSPRMNAVTIRFTTGATVPKVVQQAALLLIGDWYSNREADSMAYRTSALPAPVAALSNTVRIRGFV